MSPKVYDPKSWEPKTVSFWQQIQLGSVETQEKVQQINKFTDSYSVLMPPPNLTGHLHAGHSLQHYVMDTITRIARQKGRPALYFPGVDHAGIQLEGVIDKLIQKGEFDQQIQEYFENLEENE